MKKIAILGPENTYSDRCFHVYKKITKQDMIPLYFNSIHKVVEKGKELGYAILPFENTLDGYVQHHMDLLFSSGLKIDSEISLPIAFDYIYKEHATHLYVQYVTKNQCLDYLENHPELKIVITESNVETYQKYREDPSGAAIVPHHLVQPSDKVVEGVADEKDNHTRFLVLSKESEGLKRYHPNDPFKVSLVITPFKDRPGLLFDILKSFAEQHVNLISIMSRPTKKRLGMYHFFIELISDSTSYHVVQLILDQLKKDFDVNMLGMYPILN